MVHKEIKKCFIHFHKFQNLYLKGQAKAILFSQILCSN